MSSVRFSMVSLVLLVRVKCLVYDEIKFSAVEYAQTGLKWELTMTVEVFRSWHG